MRPGLRRSALAIFVSVSLAGLVGCGGDSGDSAAGGTYKVGAVLPLSGAAQQFGEDYQSGIEIGLDYVNNEMDLEGTFEVEFGDGEAAPAASVTEAQRLINVEKVQAMMSAFSAPTKAIAPLTERSGLMLMNGGASSPDLAGLGDHVINNVPLASQQIDPMMQYLSEELGITKIAMVYSDETLGQSLNDALDEAAPANGIEVVSSQPVSANATDYADQVAKLQDADAEALFFGLSGVGIGILGTQIQAAGLDLQYVGYAGFDSPENLSVPALDGLVFTNQHMDFESDNAPTKFLVEEYAERHPDRTVGTLVANYFSNMVILGELAKQIEDDGGEFDGDDLMERLHATDAFEVVGGSISFDEGGLVKTGIDIMKLEGGKSVFVTTQTESTS